MGLTLRFFLIISITVYLMIIINMLRKKNLNLRYTLIWLLSAFVMLVVTVFPKIIDSLAIIIGIINPVNVVFFLEAMFVLLILLSLTTIVSHLNERNRKLIQSVSLLEKRVRELEKLN
ncbi:DUF2304 domain-containing protein [Eubacterium sp.]|uniref:DUF2304 domain-containing protein n=1 Tax=Eubacterium sp. TaxID=142586 RepID=UPI002FCC5B85